MRWASSTWWWWEWGIGERSEWDRTKVEPEEFLRRYEGVSERPGDWNFTGWGNRREPPRNIQRSLKYPLQVQTRALINLALWRKYLRLKLPHILILHVSIYSLILFSLRQLSGCLLSLRRANWELETWWLALTCRIL